MSVAAEIELSDDAALKRHLGKRASVFVLTWIAYASYYFGRKAFPVVKSTLQERFGLSVGMLGWIDTGYLIAYALGQFVNGDLGDRIGSRRLVGFGMLGVAAACAAFGFSSAAWLFLIAYVVNGIFQSSGWPGTCKAMGAWFTAKERGTVMGIWSTCYHAGGLLATAVATYLFGKLGWRWAFLGPAMLIAFVALLNLFFQPERENAATDSTSSDKAIARDEWSVLRSPVLWSLAAAYF